jgi:hypothetical protein
MAHTGVQVWGRFDEDVRPYKGIPGSLISEDTHRPRAKFGADFAGGYLLQSIGVMPVTYASQLARGQKLWGDELRAHMSGYNNTAGINILGDCLPYESNFLELSDELDARGLPKPRIHFTAGENERRMNTHAAKLMHEIWQAAGAREMWTYIRYAHTIGTCCMGERAMKLSSTLRGAPSTSRTSTFATTRFSRARFPSIPRSPSWRCLYAPPIAFSNKPDNPLPRASLATTNRPERASPTNQIALNAFSIN